jgi:hypothetical protein
LLREGAARDRNQPALGSKTQQGERSMATMKEMLEQRQREQDLCAVVLDRYASSPYSYPANEYEDVVGQSILVGSWVSVAANN